MSIGALQRPDECPFLGVAGPIVFGFVVAGLARLSLAFEAAAKDETLCQSALGGGVCM